VGLFAARGRTGNKRTGDPGRQGKGMSAMLYISLLVILCAGVVIGTFVAPYLWATLAVAVRMFFDRGARTRERRQAQADEVQRRAGRQVRATRR
jgi:hypothetical protein